MLLFLFVVALHDAHGKVSEGVLHLDSDNCEQYMAKFGFSPGEQGKIEADFTVIKHKDAPAAYFDQRPHSLMMLLFTENNFYTFQKMMKEGSLCKDRVKLASFNKPISPKDENRDTGRIHLDWDVWPRDETHYWYAMVADCWLEEYPAHPPSLSFKITFMNGASHLPADERGMASFFWLCTLALLGACGLFGYKLVTNYKQSGSIHLAVLALGAALGLQLLSVLCELWHVRKFARDGMGYRWKNSWLPLDFFAEVFQGQSELVLSLLLVFVSFGWTLIEKSNYVMFHGVNKKSVAFCLSLLGLQVLLELASRKYEDDFNQFHDHEHWPGFAFMALRVLLCVLFWFGTRATAQVATKPTAKSFLFKLRLVGSGWFLAFPLLVLASSLVAVHLRRGMVTAGSIGFQIVAMALLGWLLMSGHGEYFNISSLKSMGDILPGIEPASSPVLSPLAPGGISMRKIATD
eukprot:g23628.t1